MDLNQKYRLDVENRLKSVIWVVLAFFLVVVIRLYQLQIVKGNYYRTFSQENSVKSVLIPTPRGEITDRTGEMIVGNRPVFDLVVIPQYITDREALAETLARFLEVEPAVMSDRLKGAKRFPAYRPFVLEDDVDLDLVSVVRAHKSPFSGEDSRHNLDGVEVQYRFMRDYTEGDIAPHLVGYVREIDRERLEEYRRRFPGRYRRGDYIGINGIEQMWDLELRGVKGIEQKVVNALGREVDYSGMSLELVNMSPVSGNVLYTTLDSNLQRVAKASLGDRRGAVVALDPSDGAVLAMYSTPAYDLSRLQGEERNSYWSRLIGDDSHPLFNRATGGLYPPASTYKIVTAIAALEEGIVNERGRVNCQGGLLFGNRFFGCWLGSGHGHVDIIDAITRSCDTFFYSMGLKLGVDRLARYAKMMGLGMETGIDLPGEKRGLIPTTRWKMEARSQEWREGETLSVSIGQGYNLVTPLQMAVVIAEVANNGYRVTPHIVDRIVSSEGRSLYRWSGKKRKIGGISPKTWALVKKGLIDVIESSEGTAHNLNPLNLKIAGKTGTAQVVGREAKTGKALHRTHAWFVGFAPYDNPTIAVAVIVEHGGHGAGAAAPIVAEVIKKYGTDHH